MIVRDKTKPSEYKGRPTDARDELCPCRACWHPHDCGYRNTVGHWMVRMECATRYNHGCPERKPDAEHVYASERGRVCKRCGERRAG